MNALQSHVMLKMSAIKGYRWHVRSPLKKGECYQIKLFATEPICASGTTPEQKYEKKDGQSYQMF